MLGQLLLLLARVSGKCWVRDEVGGAPELALAPPPPPLKALPGPGFPPPLVAHLGRIWAPSQDIL